MILAIVDVVYVVVGNVLSTIMMIVLYVQRLNMEIEADFWNEYFRTHYT